MAFMYDSLYRTHDEGSRAEPGQKVDVRYSVSGETVERSSHELPTVRESRVVNTATSVAVK
ncbi:hypothetical protein [Caniella muris]|uniref:hypothetical protein n=1 Tax=Caniella muris TaxID=2941502 RepID=UPI00203CC946|nr:hypothetical protein [Caniella muris]